MIAMATGFHELNLNEDEGKQYANAVQNVMRHYSVQATQKTIDWIALIGTLGLIYGPRAVAILNRQPPAPPKAKPRGPADVVQLHPNAPQRPQAEQHAPTAAPLFQQVDLGMVENTDPVY